MIVNAFIVFQEFKKENPSNQFYLEKLYYMRTN
jgi:hypothetical protein